MEREVLDELVKRLREPCQYENCILCQQAADAIEELMRRCEQSAQPTQKNDSNALEVLDCVSRQAAIDAVHRDANPFLEYAASQIEQLPSAQPLTAYVISDEDGNIKCSNCGGLECWGNYCMNCGAKMRGENNG